jgi:hypothetical protein
MKAILLSHCCARGQVKFAEIVAEVGKTEKVTIERRQVHGRILPIMERIGINDTDVRLSPYVIILDDNDKIMQWCKINDWKSEIREK